MHNGYLYPNDVKIETINGTRKASIDFSLPTIWTKEALKVAKKCCLSGWEIARRAYEREQRGLWFKKAYPRYHQESLDFMEHIRSGGSMTSWVTLNTKVNNTGD